MSVASLLVFGAVGQAGASQSAVLENSVLKVLPQSKVIGPASPSEVLHLGFGLQPRFPAELQAFCDSVSNPKSPNYRQFMTPREVGEAFGASSDDVNALVSFLKGHGMKVMLVANNRMEVLADATVAQVQSTFKTGFHTYTGPDPEGNTITFRANSVPLTLPARLSGLVIEVSGLESYTRPKPAATSTLTPPLARGLYGSAPGYNLLFQGQGMTIGFSNWVGLRVSQASLYISQYGLPVPAGGAGSNIQVVTVNSGAASHSENAEGDLDMQMQLGMVPLANILIYDNGSNDLVAVLTKEANDNLCNVISESYGWSSSAPISSAHNQHLAMTAQGITYLAAAGDTGTSWPQSWPYPDIDPEVLSIGGTIATVDSTTGARQSEVTWSGGGGGWSTLSNAINVLPSWQVGNGVPTGNNHRLLPDIALHSAGSGSAGSDYFYYRNSLTSGYTGTSFAAPRTAGEILALEQRLVANGQPGRLGRMQDMIYAENGRSDVWYDVISGNVGTLPDGSSSAAHAGWDFSTGWGAPNFDGWFAALAAVTTVPSSYQVLQGTYLSGNVASLANVDQDYLTVRQVVAPVISQPPVDVLVTGTTTLHTPSSFAFKVVSHVSSIHVNQIVRLFNTSTNTWQTVDTRSATGSDQTVTVSITSNASQYVAADGTVQARIQFTPNGPTPTAGWSGSIDQAVWALNP
ncbi:MAG TPA: protease pro-enzyme activation domain-containing protein [Fimbriimonadaceae bacterium]|nr:protease pro-enzyme activation domain-containing protein [Fimbriimonadaceae bacterium]